jgi:hypothetical protein
MQKSHKDPNITILHGLVDAIQNSSVECVDFTKELNFVDDASSGWFFIIGILKFKMFPDSSVKFYGNTI